MCVTHAPGGVDPAGRSGLDHGRRKDSQVKVQVQVQAPVKARQ
jgi:hypothetical protein